jgi:hypothetical protein
MDKITALFVEMPRWLCGVFYILEYGSCGIYCNATNKTRTLSAQTAKPQNFPGQHRVTIDTENSYEEI